MKAGVHTSSVRASLALLLSLVLRAGAAETVVSLNFDDNLGTQRIAQSVLNARGVKATFFVNTGYVGTSGYYLSLSDLRALASQGHEIAGHTLTHQDLTAVSSAEARRQVCDDRQQLINWGFNPVDFAYPVGPYNASVQTIVRDCGYASARGVGGLGCSGCVKAESLPPADRYGIRTPILVRTETTLADLQRYVTDAENAGGGLVPLIIHHICNGCNSDSLTEANLTAFVDWLTARAGRGTVVRTMAQALSGAPPPPSAPVISALSPSGAVAGGPAFTLTVTGSGFAADAVVRWNGSARPSSITSSSQMSASISATDIAAAGTVAVTVAESAGTSNAATFTVSPAGGGGSAPSITALSPASWPAGGSAFNLTVDGSGFSSGAVVRWNGLDRPGVLQGTTRLIVYIGPGDVATPGTAQVTVFKSGAGTSNALPFTVTGSGGGGNPSPSAASMSPASATAGGAAFTLTVNGSNFVSGAVVRWNGADRPTTFVGSTQLRAAIGAADVSAAGTDSVTVFNPAPGGGLSNALSFTVSPSGGSGGGPVITAISPNSRAAGGAAFNLTVDGTGFTSGAFVRWNGSVRTGTLQGTTRLIVYISPSDVAAPGTVSVTAANPGGGDSNSLPFTVTGSGSGGGVPSITALSPSSRPAGSSAFNLTVDGSNYASGALVRWNGLDRPGTLQGTSRLIVYIPASDVASPGTAQVTVFNPGGGGGTSNALPFTVGGAGAAAAAPAASTEFVFGELYAFPNPSRRGQRVTIRVAAGLTDAVDVRVYDLAGRYLAGGSAAPPRVVDGVFASDFVWDASNAGSGIYLYSVTAKKAGAPDIVRTGRVGVIR